MELTAERDELLLRLNDCKVRRKIRNAKCGNKRLFANTMTASVKQLKKRVSLLEDEHRLPQKTSEYLMRKYSEQKPVVRRSV